MGEQFLRREQWIGRAREEVFAFFADAANLEALTPPWLRFEIVRPTPIAMGVGTLITYRIRWRFVRLTWESEIVEWDPPLRFADVQLRGPYKHWHHTHTFLEENGGTRMIDEVRYSLPLGIVGRVVHRLKVRHDLAAIFDYRAERLAGIFG